MFVCMYLTRIWRKMFIRQLFFVHRRIYTLRENVVNKWSGDIIRLNNLSQQNYNSNNSSNYNNNSNSFKQQQEQQQLNR